MSWLGKLEAAEAEFARANTDAWITTLERAQGCIGHDGLERISSQRLFDVLDLPLKSRGQAASRRLKAAMVQLGWMPTRVRDVTGRGFTENIRGYARRPQC